MQLDMFGATETSATHEAAPPVISGGAWVPPEALAFDAALRRGSLGDAIGILNQLKVNAASRVLLASGFAVGDVSNRANMIAGVQSDIVAASRLRLTGMELRAARLKGALHTLQVTNDLDKENNLLFNNDNYSQMPANIENQEEINHVRRSLQSRSLPGESGSSDRGDGVDSRVYREPMDAGVAGTGETVAAIRDVPGLPENANGSGERSPGEHSGYEPSIPSGNPAIIRSEGKPAVDAVGRGGVVAAEFGFDDPNENWLDEKREDSITADLQSAVPSFQPVTAAVPIDYVLTDEDRIGLGSLAEKFQDNLNAIRIVKSLAAEGRDATPEERRDLVRYVGWGGLKGVFDPDNKQWARQHVTLKSLLSDSEWAAARRSQLDAFYTPPMVAKAMYSAVSRMGYQYGRMVDPSVGVGTFFGLMPEGMRQGSTLHGVELDLLTSGIVSALYPSAKIAKATGFQSYQVPAGYFDMVIGNPPFGSQAITDDVGSVYSGWSIHNYFFAKSIEMLRPGGIMPMVVSHSFLDKLDPHVRQWISRRAELVSGVRLPNSAFKENANTEVVTDVLIFRRLDDSLMLGKQELPDWLNTSEVMVENSKTGVVEPIMVNDYFIKNPERVLGNQIAVSSQFSANDYTVEPNGNLEEQLAAWVDTLPKGIYVPLERSAVELEMSAVSIPDGIKEGSFFIQNGAVHHRLKDSFGEQRAAPWEAPNQKAAERMVGMIGIRDTLRNQMRLERSINATDAMIEDGRKELNRVYNEFQKKFGFLNDPMNRRLFLDDTESALVQALEFDYEKAITPAKAEEFGIEPRPSRAVRADILNQRVLFPPVEIANVETAKDALLHSLNMTGRMDLAFMQNVYAKDESAILEELGDVVFRDPVEGWVTADAYLAGDVKTKLATVTKAAKTDLSLTRNVVALEGVIPKDKLPSEIFAAIGAAWVPADIYSQFVKELSGADVTYSYIGATAHWLSSNHGGGDYGKNNTVFGTDRMGAIEILSHLMNSKGLEVKKRVLIDGREQYVTDEDATEAVRQRGDKIRAHWDSWLWSDGGRADRLTEIYNERFNRFVERQFDGSHLTFPGMSPAVTLLQHQKDGVWRGMQDRVMLADQVVGAGKTFELATIAMEMRRLGIAKKPMFGVPNHLTLQWRSEFYRLYPGSNILAATPQDFDKENREKFFSKIVTGNWDAVIVGHSSLKKVGVPLEAEISIIEEQFNDMADAIETMKRERGDRKIIRDMEKIKANLEAKINKLQEKGGKKDNVVDFGDLGVDALFIDELHEFKNLFFSTQMNRVAGLGNPAGSGKAFDLFVKTRWMQETYGDNAPFIGATGTPVSNSLSEMFTMQRYMQYSKLKEDGLHMFDAWAKQYGDVQTVYEVAPSGTGYRLSQRFAKFKNLGSLMGSYHSFADVITLDDLKAQEIAAGKTFPVPKLAGGKPLNVVAQRSELQERFFGIPEIVRGENGEILFEVDLSKPVTIVEQDDGKWRLESAGLLKAFPTRQEAEYALAVASTTPRMTIDPKSIVGQFDNLRELTRKTKGKINALSLTGLANKAGLDYRIIDAQAEDFPGSKINLAVNDMLSTYHDWNADKGVQLVFCDLSVPLSAKAKMASKEKRVYVRDAKGEITHKKGTLHVPKGYEGLPYYLVAEGKGSARTFTMFDPLTGVVLREGFDSKQDAHAFASEFVAREGGQERWLDMRERMRPIEADEIDDYKNHHSLDNDGDAADFEISAQDIEGATGVSGFSVYDDMKAKLVAAGVPAHEIEFIHDHDTPQSKDALFKRVNAGDVRFLFGSTPKMGAGTNVQKRLVALHHIDAPWRPSDLEQREGRIIRRGNELYERDPEGFEIKVNRYATSQTYDTRRWQLLEHKAAGVEQLRKYNGENEIDDVASEASNSADMKAAASGNPLILKETQLANEVKKLSALSRAHLDGEYMVRSRMNSHKNFSESFGPSRLAELNEMLALRESASSLGVFDGRKLAEKENVLAAMEKIAVTLQAMGAEKPIVYRGTTFRFSRFDKNYVTLTMPDGEYNHMDAISPSGSITRMENFVNGLEGRIAEVEARIASSAIEAVKMAGLLGKPFDRAEDLAIAIAEHGKVQRALMKANSSAAVKPEERDEFDVRVTNQKELLKSIGFADAVKEIEAGDDIDFNSMMTPADGLETVSNDQQSQDPVSNFVSERQEAPQLISTEGPVGGTGNGHASDASMSIGHSHASVGGENGVNGYFYKGGQFLPSTIAEPGRWKVGTKWISSGKELVEPGVIAAQPTPFSRSIMAMIHGWCLIEDGRLALRQGVNDNGIPITLETLMRPGVKGVLGREELSLGELIDAYNSGQRWFDVQPDAVVITTENTGTTGSEVGLSSMAPITHDRESIARLYAEALAEGRSDVKPEPVDMHYRFADAVLEKNAYRLDYLANGLNNTGKRVFTEVTGVELPKQQGATWAAIREWSGLSESEDNKNKAWQAVVFERRQIESKVGLNAIVWANDKVESGYDRIQKSGRESWLVNANGVGFNLSKKGSHLTMLMPYLKAKIVYEEARLATGMGQENSSVDLSLGSSKPADVANLGEQAMAQENKELGAEKSAPYDANDMDAAVEYSRETKRLFTTADVDAAYEHYMQDPNGGANQAFAKTTKEDFIQSMQRTSGGPVASVQLSANERQAWSEAGASDVEIEDIARFGGFEKLRVNGQKLLDLQDMLDHVMQSRIIKIRNELRDLGWEGEQGKSLERQVGDTKFRTNLATVNVGAGRNVVDFKFDVVNISNATHLSLVVDNDMNLSVKAMANAVSDALLSKLLVPESEHQVSDVSKIQLPYASVDMDIAHLKTRLVETLPDDIQDGWIVMNAPRPLRGNETFNGEFVSGRFYSVIDPDDLMAEKYVEKNLELDARLLVAIPRDLQMEMAMHGSNYRDRYMEVDADQRYEMLSSSLNKLRDMPYGELTELLSKAIEVQAREIGQQKVPGVVNEGFYSGRVSKIEGGIVTQKIGRDPDMVVLHEVSRLSGLPNIDEVVDIQYRGGKGEVTDKSKSVGVGIG
jgi:N12 class adenine-specific DNA methylase/predicted RNA methylase